MSGTTGTATAGATRPTFNPWRVYGVAALTFAALAVGGYLGGVSPALARAARAEDERRELSEQKTRAAELTAAIAAAREDLTATREALVALPLKLEPATLVNERLARLTDMAGGVSLSVAEVRPGAPVEGRDFDSVPITIAGTGTYPACAAFLRRLHAQFPDTAVRSLRAAQTDGGPATFTVDLVWYTTRRK